MMAQCATRKQGHKQTLTHTHTHTHINMYVEIGIFVCHPARCIALIQRRVVLYTHKSASSAPGSVLSSFNATFLNGVTLIGRENMYGFLKALNVNTKFKNCIIITSEC
ncbi:unnamed protein product [Ceratitis capitata]|uniref:(Mediterranean fruit fly) hypothetical protein n=1 Tax=Ceratitis capitata TaxID=7213 RepID=A0A811VG34_CERCA|nr:unnamed protein product [Ceratitis capitata]